MSNIGGKVREFKEFKKRIGLFEANVIAVNPSAEELKEKFNIELKEDSKLANYLGEDEDGNTTLRVVFWVNDVKNPDDKYQVSLFLTNKERLNKDETKNQYINNIGVTTWAADENDLPEWFKKRPYRKAKVGEEELYKFLRTWLGKLDYRAEDSVLELDWKPLMKGNVKDIRAQIGGAYCTNVGLLATVRVTEEGKEYQGIYNHDFLPVYSLKNFNLIDYENEEVIKKVAAKEPKDQKPHEKFAVQLKGEYGCKDYYILKSIRDYNSDENPVSSNAPMVGEQDDPNY